MIRLPLLATFILTLMAAPVAAEPLFSDDTLIAIMDADGPTITHGQPIDTEPDDEQIDTTGLPPAGTKVCMEGPEGDNDCNWEITHYADFGNGPEPSYFYKDPNDPYSGTPYNSECNPDYCEPGYGEEAPAGETIPEGSWAPTN